MAAWREQAGGDDAMTTKTGAQADESQWRRPALTTNVRGFLRTPGTGQAQRWFFSAIWLIYLVEPVSGLFGHHHGVLWVAGGLAITIVFSVIYVIIVCNSGLWPRQARWDSPR